MLVHIASLDDRERWDAFVLSHKDAGPYHLFAWGRAVQSAYRHRLFYLIAEEDNRSVCGVLPLIRVKPPCLPGRIVSLPFCDYGGVLAHDVETAKQLIRYACSLASGLRCALEIRSKSLEPALKSEGGLGMFTHKSRMVLELPENSDILWNVFKSKLRSQIRRPQKDGLEFVLGGQSLVDEFYQVFCANMRELGSPVHSRSWIHDLIAAFGERSRVGVVYRGTTPVAGGIIVTCRGTMTLPWASSLSSHSKSSPNMLLYWGLLKYASDNGYRVFDFGRSTPGEGTYKFKAQWGALPSPLYWYGTGFSSQEPTAMADSRVRKAIEGIWARLPQRVADAVGPVVRRYITL